MQEETKETIEGLIYKPSKTAAQDKQDTEAVRNVEPTGGQKVNRVVMPRGGSQSTTTPTKSVPGTRSGVHIINKDKEINNAKKTTLISGDKARTV